MNDSTALWVSATPQCYVPPAYLLRRHCVLSSKSVINKLNNTGPSMDPWGTLLVTGIQLDSVPLITILWDLPFTPLFTLPARTSWACLWSILEFCFVHLIWGWTGRTHLQVLFLFSCTCALNIASSFCVNVVSCYGLALCWYWFLSCSRLVGKVIVQNPKLRFTTLTSYRVGWLEVLPTLLTCLKISISY